MVLRLSVPQRQERLGLHHNSPGCCQKSSDGILLTSIQEINHGGRKFVGDFDKGNVIFVKFLPKRYSKPGVKYAKTYYLFLNQKQTSISMNCFDSK